MEKRGRKATILAQDEIDSIIYRFTQEEKVSGWIKYSEVYRFTKTLYENGEIPYKLSEDYWRRDGRQGKENIDRVNKLYETTIVNKKTSDSDIFVDTEECVNKFFTGKPSDKKRFIQALKINEKKAKDSNRLLNKIDNLEQKLSIMEAKYKKSIGLNEEYQKILFSWFNASVKTDVPLINLITTGQSRQPIVDLFFETAFSKPLEGYEKFEEYRKKNNSNVDSSIGTVNDNVVTPIRKSKLQQITENFRDS